jgi:hypothetical protein
VFVKLQEQLLSQERELDIREGTIVTWEEGLTTFARVLKEVSMVHDASHAHMDAIRWDFSTQVCASSARSGQLTDHGRTLEGR